VSKMIISKEDEYEEKERERRECGRKEIEIK
jgi:hypothetical protein